ncbi:MAG: DUF4920 domain-containing protein [Saprospiraceae bacterium]|nr:DUF4920 domain-containing protein [Saprospiraceae bacterium]
MIKHIFVTLSIFLFTLVALQAQQPTTESDYDHFGAVISPEGAMDYSELMMLLEDKDSVEAKVKASVQGVCKVKGCWMNITDQNAPSTFVQFEDYGFFVPKDLSGEEVIIEGIAYKATTSVEELRHYAQDEGKSKEEIAQITEPAEELKFMATGVLIKK